jgi:HlyD family secretion protein
MTRTGDAPGLMARVEGWHVSVALLVLAVAGLGLYGLWPVLVGSSDTGPAAEEAEAPSSRAQVDALVVERTDFPLRTQASGHLVPWQRATIYAEADGPVVRRAVEEGDRVASGGLLARLDNQEEKIALEEARAELLKTRATFEAQYGDDAPAVAAADTARVGSERRATQAASSGLMAARQAVERARLRLRRTRITAPFGGRVADLKVEEGQYVSQGAKVATLLRDDRMKVEVDVLEEDMVHIQKGATARVHVPALGGPSDSTAHVTGRVWAVNPQVDPQTGTGRVTVAVPNPERRLVSGLYANVRLETERLADRLVVPDEAVLVRQGRELVFVIEDGQAQWTYVELGARSGDYVAIADGVQPGDTVAVDGHFALAHDAPVAVSEVRPLGLQ